MNKQIKEIKEYLDRYIEGQEDAKRCAAVLVYNKLRGVKENICFVGPSGCGKTEIFRVLSRKFPRLIYIHTASGHTTQGFKGNKKFNSCFNDMAAQGWTYEEMENSIVVMDEFDKVVEPTGSSEGNISREFQREFLTMVEGANIRINMDPNVRDDDAQTIFNTSNVSFVFCGAFDDIFRERKKKSSIQMGFKSENEDLMNKEVTIEDLIKFGMRNELAGRISMVATLYRLNRDQVRNLLKDPYRSPVSKLAIQYKCNIRVSREFFEELIDFSQTSDTGVRDLTGKVQREIDRELYEEGSSGKITVMELTKPKEQYFSLENISDTDYMR